MTVMCCIHMELPWRLYLGDVIKAKLKLFQCIWEWDFDGIGISTKP